MGSGYSFDTNGEFICLVENKNTVDTNCESNDVKININENVIKQDNNLLFSLRDVFSESLYTMGGCFNRYRSYQRPKLTDQAKINLLQSLLKAEIENSKILEQKIKTMKAQHIRKQELNNSAIRPKSDDCGFYGEIPKIQE